MVHDMANLIFEIYKSPLTVFSLRELALLMNESDENKLKAKVNYHVKKGKLLALRRGIYAKENYHPLELANKIFIPSYISLETVLQEAGVINQYYETIFIVSYLSREIKVKNHRFRYRKIKDQILSNPLGLQQLAGYAIARPERAFLDALYIYKTYHFDKLDRLDQEQIFLMIENVYRSKIMERQAKELLGARHA